MRTPEQRARLPLAEWEQELRDAVADLSPFQFALEGLQMGARWLDGQPLPTESRPSHIALLRETYPSEEATLAIDRGGKWAAGRMRDSPFSRLRMGGVYRGETISLLQQLEAAGMDLPLRNLAYLIRLFQDACDRQREIAEPFLQAVRSGQLASRPDRGNEAIYWRSRMLGGPTRPGVLESHGFEVAAYRSIHAQGKDMFRQDWEDAEPLLGQVVFLRTTRSQGLSMAEFRRSVATAIAGRDLAGARQLLKECLYRFPDVINERGHQLLRLTPEETADMATRFGRGRGHEQVRSERARLASDQMQAALRMRADNTGTDVLEALDAYACQLFVDRNSGELLYPGHRGVRRPAPIRGESRRMGTWINSISIRRFQRHGSMADCRSASQAYPATVLAWLQSGALVRLGRVAHFDDVREFEIPETLVEAALHGSHSTEIEDLQLSVTRRSNEIETSRETDWNLDVAEVADRYSRIAFTNSFGNTLFYVHGRLHAAGEDLQRPSIGVSHWEITGMAAKLVTHSGYSPGLLLRFIHSGSWRPLGSLDEPVTGATSFVLPDHILAALSVVAGEHRRLAGSPKPSGDSLGGPTG